MKKKKRKNLLETGNKYDKLIFNGLKRFFFLHDKSLLIIISVVPEKNPLK